MKKIMLLWIYVLFLIALPIKVIAVPSLSGVIVLPENPNAGQDLLCNYTYSSPENYTEQNSTFEWFKDGIDQNINSQILNKNNLSINDKWSCEVTGYDGLDFSTSVQSNNVTILDTVQNPAMYVNGTNVSKETGFFGNEKNVIGFNEELSNALANCTADAEGFCNITFTFSSDNAGLLNLTDLGVYYTENIVSLAIESITTMNTNGTQKTFEFVILNDGDTTVTDIQWQFDTGDSNVINSTINISSISSGEKAFVYLQHNFSNIGSFNVKANATGLSQSNVVAGSLSSSISIGDLIIESFDGINLDGLDVIFESKVKNNNLDLNITDINWSLTTDDGTIINATQLFDLQPNETIFIYTQYKYSSAGTFNTSFTVSNHAYSDSENTIIEIKELEISNLSVLNINETERLFEIIIENGLFINLTNVSWTFDTKNSNVVNGTSTFILQSSEKMFVYIDYNFTTTGTFNVNATARNGTLTDSGNLTVII